MDTSKAMVKTAVKMSYDNEHLYLIAICYNKPDQAYMVESLKRDFVFGKNDNFLLFMDPFDDQTNGFSFGSNAAGAQWDGIMYDGGKVDLNWDNKWSSAVKNYQDKWIWEAAIPFKTIRYKNGIKTWGINFSRLDITMAEKSSWAPVPRQFPTATLAYSGQLIWDEPPPEAGTNISMIPYVLTSGSKNYSAGTKNVFKKEIGLDAKIGITSSLNLDLTFNPDFSQVEVDNQVTNLDRFEILFPEKRQFFLENGDLFANFGVDGIRPFFSRRIGVTRDPSTGQNIQNRIEAGMRMSGKIGDDLRLGVLQMRTAAIDSIGQAANDFSVIALQHKVFTRSSIGVLFTNKEVSGSKDFNRVAGIDYNIASKNNAWNGKLFYMMSFDPFKTSNDKAMGGSIVYNKRNFEMRQRLYSIGKEFNPEVGYLRRGGFLRYAGDATWKIYPKNTGVNKHGPMVDYDFTLFPSKGITDYDLNFIYNILYKNYFTLLFRARRDFTRLTEDFDPTNSGGTKLKANQEFVYHSIIASLISDQRKKLVAKLQTRSGQYFNGSRLNLDGEITYRIQPFGSISSVFSFNRLRFPQPYKSANLLLAGPKIDLTFSKSVFLSTLIQYNSQINNINMNIRFQWRFAPASDLFLVYTDNYYADNYMSKGSALVLKATYWFNL